MKAVPVTYLSHKNKADKIECKHSLYNNIYHLLI